MTSPVAEVPAAAVSRPDVPCTTGATPSQPEEVAAEDQELSHQDLEELEDLIEVIAEEKMIKLDKESLEALKEDVDEYQEVRIGATCLYY